MMPSGAVQVPWWPSGRAGFPQHGGDAFVGGRDVEVALVEVAEEFIEAVGEWVEVLARAEVPLADHAGRVACLAEEFGEKALARRDAVFAPALDVWHDIDVPAEAPLVAAGEEAGA